MSAAGFKKSWQNFWFQPALPADLGVIRFVFFGAMLIFMGNQFSLQWATLPPEFWSPVSFFRWGISQPSVPALRSAIAAWDAAVLFSALGLLAPLSMSVAAVLSFYLLGLSHCFGNVVPDDANLVLFSFVLALAPCGQGFSLDALIRKKYPSWGRWNQTPVTVWPIRLIWFIWAMMFFAAALSKLHHSGLAWVFSDNLAGHILHNQYWYSFRLPWFAGLGFGNLGAFVGRFPILCKWMAGGALMLELSLPLIVFSRRARNLLVPLSFLFQAACALILLVDFKESLFAYLFFVPWLRLPGFKSLLRRSSD